MGVPASPQLDLLLKLQESVDRARADRAAAPTCSEPECDKPVFCKGRCRSHDNKARYAADPERHRARSRAWHSANPDKAKAKNARRDKAADAARARAWYAANRLRAIATQANRRARQFDVPGDVTADGLLARITYFASICWICKKPGADSIDHVLPLGAGGPNFHSNIRPAHLGCNAARSWEGRNR